MPSIINSADLKAALDCLRQGGILGYPTEAVYGLGCDPFNLSAVNRLLQLKHRAVEKGLILIAADWSQVENLVEPVPPGSLTRVLAAWPGPATWIFPASSQVPRWIRGQHKGVALRVSQHPVVVELCQAYGKPIVSTSANREGQLPLRDYRSMKIVFGKEIDFILPGKVGGLAKPTPIRDAVTGEVLRD